MAAVVLLRRTKSVDRDGMKGRIRDKFKNNQRMVCIMFNNDFAKMFDPASYAQNFQANMQKMWDMNSAMSASMAAGKQNMEIMKKVSSTIADTYSTCSEKQFKYAQSAMEDCIEAMRELGSAKGMEEYMQKQTQLSQKYAEKAQSCAQEMAGYWQKAQSQCSDIISKQMMQGMEWSKSSSSSSKNNS